MFIFFCLFYTETHKINNNLVWIEVRMRNRANENSLFLYSSHIHCTNDAPLNCRLITSFSLHWMHLNTLNLPIFCAIQRLHDFGVAHMECISYHRLSWSVCTSHILWLKIITFFHFVVILERRNEKQRWSRVLLSPLLKRKSSISVLVIFSTFSI